MQEYYFICGGSAAAFFYTPERCASITVTRTEYQTSVVRVPADNVGRLARWRKHTEITKEKFFQIYHAATRLNNPSAQKYLDLLTPAPLPVVPDLNHFDSNILPGPGAAAK